MHEGHEEPGAISAEVNRIGKAATDAAFTVHSALGPGLLESVYEACLFEELRAVGLAVDRQVAIPLRYREARLDVGFRLDLLVDRSVIVEIKAIDALASIHVAQVLTYLKFSNLRLGYLLNFNVSRLKDGLRRIVL
ncbi:GxxExxY protein [Brevundimonas sp. LM2]|uniref:GxxExxY protein n=1 Tax=Brevundimonas sp. LM2 TaxID=1938605 RepID=UPI000983B4DD|nr:GxxExxY protein [Brevundimonas sp. LM2]AQR63236.1 GxxExxY protein [Brevundimonas sp. LM2]